MSTYYYDEAACEKWINRIKHSSGTKKSECLEELCKFKTKAADEFWNEMRSEEQLPYIMMCRCDEASDYSADILDKFIDRIVEARYDRYEMINEAYFLLHTCMNKESDKLMSVYRKIARNYDIIQSRKLCWNEQDTILDYRQPDFLYNRYLMEMENGCESDFFSMLTDILILTMSWAVLNDGNDETFTAKVKDLYNDYPDVFASAGFFAYFVKDTSEAYDKFSHLLNDPIDYPYINWVLDGLEYINGEYIQGSPTCFVGPDNRAVHYSIPIENLDFRWYEFFTDKILDDAKNMSLTNKSNPYFMKNFLEKFSSRVYYLINPEDERIMSCCKNYFRQTAVLAGNPVDYYGLKSTEAVTTGSELSEISMEIAKAICEGRQNYCLNILFSVFSNIEREDRITAVTAAAEYLLENDRNEENYDELCFFVKQAELMRSGQPNCFESIKN